MTKTVNRQPFSVNTPTSSDLKKYYFSHANWKGICTDKNYFNIDQETFESAKNVYMDSDAILKSRPAIKYDNNSDILNIWKFDKLTVYLKKGSPNYLEFVKSDGTTLKSSEYSDNVKLLAHDGKIWIFDNDSLLYYKDDEIYNGEDYIYVPKNSIVNDDIETLVEEDNILTTKKINRYIYDTNMASYSSLYGKDVSIKLNDITTSYNDFNREYLPAIVAKTKHKFTSNNFADEYILGPGNKGKPLIDVADNGNMILCEFSRYTTETTNSTTERLEILQQIEWTIFFSNDGGNIFTKIATVDNVIGMPVITRDGGSIGVLKEDGVYFIRPGEMSFRKTIDAVENVSNDVYWPKLYARDSNGELHNCEFNYNTTTTLCAVDEHNCFICFGAEFDGIDSIETNAITGDVVYTVGYDTYSVFPHNLPVDWTKFPIATYFGYILVTDGTVTHKEFNDEYVYPSSPIVYSTGDEYIFLTAFISLFTDTTYRKYIAEVKLNSAVRSGRTPDYLAPLFSKSSVTTKYLQVTTIDRGDSVEGRLYELQSAGEASITLTQLYEEDGEIFACAVLSSHVTDTLSILMPQELRVVNVVNKQQTLVNYTVNGDSNIPLYVRDEFSLLVNDDGYLYTSKYIGTIVFDEIVPGEIKPIIPSKYLELDAWYFSDSDKLYISDAKYNDDGDFLWNFPIILSEQFTYEITNLHIISDTQVAVFFNDHVWIVTYDSENNVYHYNKSRLQVGCKEGNDIITSYDGSQTIFSTPRGLVTMSYKDFVATTEQTLTYLSDVIFDLYKAYNDDVVKLQKYDFWIYCYAEGGNDCYVLDIRNKSWWYWQFPMPLDNIYSFDELSLLSGGKLYKLSKASDNYYDEYYGKDGKIAKANVAWSLTSQKLHLSTLNYYKNVENITINSVQENKYLCTYNLKTRNYRESVDDGAVSGFEYYVDKIRTYVKWINYGKLIAFQYTLDNDFDYEEKYPLSINSIIIKYRIGGAVR